MNKINTILVTGSSGQLGQSLKRLSSDYPQYEMMFVSRDELDLSRTESIEQFFHQHQFDLIINCAAYTAVDKAESEPELADKANHLAVKKLAEIACLQKSKLIHVSTDYVFNGQHSMPYLETDAVEPQGVYGLTKLLGEQALAAAMPENSLIIRTSWVYSEFGSNFVKTMLKLGQARDSLTVVFDQIGTPTYAHDLATDIMAIAGHSSFNSVNFTSDIVHYSNEGVCSWYDFAKSIFELSTVDCRVEPIEAKEYPTPAVRPHYSVLNKTKIKDCYGVEIPYWKDSLQICLEILQEKSE